MDKKMQELREIFEKANIQFLKKNKMLFETRVAERTLCGALMLELHDVIKATKYLNYYVDVEYNRNIGGKIKTLKKTIKSAEEQIITINCDLIVHSRGQNALHDNLIALEMKKSNARPCYKKKDRERLQCLTKHPDGDVWSYDGKIFPEHVCGYDLGIYYEVDFRRNMVVIEYYKDGNHIFQYDIFLEKL